ncbi:hypothetical protein OY671_007514, partial [Metschnikowia pulcherrima]
MSSSASGSVAGVSVDDAIVEIENVVRHIRMGKSAYQASVDAAGEIGSAVSATTFSIVAVFFPVASMPGVSGQFFKNFGMTVVVAVSFSSSVARMITPMVAAYFSKAHGHAEHGGGPWMDRYMKISTWSLDTSRVQAYLASVRARGIRPGFRHWTMARSRDHRLWMMGIGFAASSSTGVMFMVIPQQFFPDTDNDFSTITIDMVPGTTIEQTEQKVDEVSASVKDQPDSGVASERIREGNGRVFLNWKKDRKESSLVLERKSTPVSQQVSDARVNFQSQNGGGPGGG